MKSFDEFWREEEEDGNASYDDLTMIYGIQFKDIPLFKRRNTSAAAKNVHLSQKVIEARKKDLERRRAELDIRAEDVESRKRELEIANQRYEASLRKSVKMGQPIYERLKAVENSGGCLTDRQKEIMTTHEEFLKKLKEIERREGRMP